jgi:hypothetical protein
MAESRPNLSELLESEYKILQDKIDKIGAFKLTVRGWSVTIVLASLFAVASSKSMPPEIVLVLLLFIVAFYLMERAELSLGRKLKARILQIEEVLTRLIGEATPSPTSLYGLGNIPGIASQSIRKRAVPLSWRFRQLPREIFITTFLFYSAQAVAVVATFLVLKAMDQHPGNLKPRLMLVERPGYEHRDVLPPGKEWRCPESKK